MNTREVVRAVACQMGRRQLKQLAVDIVRGGADAGWNGFTYNADMRRFFRRHTAVCEEVLDYMLRTDESGAVEQIKRYGLCVAVSWYALELAAHAIISNKGD